MRPTVEELHHSGQYRLIESFKIDEMNQFIMRELGTAPSPQQSARQNWKKTLTMMGVGAISGALGFTVTYYLVSSVGKSGAGTELWEIGAAVLGLFLLLPIHELIHGLAFKYIGAPKVGYGYSLKSLMVYAYSQHFPTTMREVAFVAVMPFLVITIGLVAGWVLVPAYYVFWAGLLLIHSSACIGDFVLIRYWYRHRPRTIYTYDDVEGERMSYFFEPVETQPPGGPALASPDRMGYVS
ncbi:DUF3267 domain-containing protein [Spirosoma sordidisoli]|uniref:DUF3267 domain-containing protein n=1 Tax=Spirosoma sordidisoli TaxID=2502893 RepID=A0A4Q2UUY0_9BACT|nr:DUF3267 domain-containing protein [Spirosoma sordidisoli]RYC71665.1 DUF3267 domain-containing protein [Spirosoma sordidisoli]